MSIEILENNLNRQLDWVKTADSKVPPVFAIATAMLGLLATLMKVETAWGYPVAIACAINLILLLASIGFLALSMFPRTGGPKGSNIYFGGIVTKSESDYLTAMSNIDEVSYSNDLILQTYRNAGIVNDKYSNIKTATIMLFISVPVWLVSIYMLYGR
jgi:hypothetical protein